MKKLSFPNRGVTSALMFAMMLGSAGRVLADEPRHEKIDAARKVLIDAYHDLEKASDDFGGHKKEAMEKISEATHALEKWHDNVPDATDKVDKAIEQLHICKDKSRERHPRIEEATTALEAAREELASMTPTAPVIEPKTSRIDEARHALTAAYEDLDKAADDFDGHKAQAMEKIKEAGKSIETWHEHVGEAREKVDQAIDQLRICRDKGHEHHPKIEQAIDALTAAKEELK